MDKKITSGNARNNFEQESKSYGASPADIVYGLRKMALYQEDIETANTLEQVEASENGDITIKDATGEKMIIRDYGLINSHWEFVASSNSRNGTFGYVLKHSRVSDTQAKSVLKQFIANGKNGLSDADLLALLKKRMNKAYDMLFLTNLAKLRAILPDTVELKYSIGFKESKQAGRLLFNITHDELGNFKKEAFDLIRDCVANNILPPEVLALPESD